MQLWTQTCITEYKSFLLWELSDCTYFTKSPRSLSEDVIIEQARCSGRWVDKRATHCKSSVKEYMRCANCLWRSFHNWSVMPGLGSSNALQRASCTRRWAFTENNMVYHELQEKREAKYQGNLPSTFMYGTFTLQFISTLWDFKFSRRRAWSSESSGMYCHVLNWMSMFQRCVLPPSSGHSSPWW
jgi:hypothetical protein